MISELPSFTPPSPPRAEISVLSTMSNEALTLHGADKRFLDAAHNMLTGTELSAEDFMGEAIELQGVGTSISDMWREEGWHENRRYAAFSIGDHILRSSTRRDVYLATLQYGLGGLGLVFVLAQYMGERAEGSTLHFFPASTVDQGLAYTTNSAAAMLEYARASSEPT